MLFEVDIDLDDFLDEVDDSKIIAYLDKRKAYLDKRKACFEESDIKNFKEEILTELSNIKNGGDIKECLLIIERKLDIDL